MQTSDSICWKSPISTHPAYIWRPRPVEFRGDLWHQKTRVADKSGSTEWLCTGLQEKVPTLIRTTRRRRRRCSLGCVRLKTTAWTGAPATSWSTSDASTASTSHSCLFTGPHRTQQCLAKILLWKLIQAIYKWYNNNNNNSKMIITVINNNNHIQIIRKLIS